MPTPSILSGTTVHGRRSSFKFLSDAASVLTQSRRKHTNRISTLIGSAPAPSHNRALKLVVHLSAAHALRHGHDVTHTANVLVSLITVCHDVCSRCRTPHLDVLDEAICQEVDRHLVGLVDDLSASSFADRVWAARYICIIHTAHPLFAARFISLNLLVAAEMSLHQVKNLSESANDEQALEALQLLIQANNTQFVKVFALQDVLCQRPLAKPEIWDVFVRSALDTLTQRNILSVCFRTRMIAAMEYALKRYGIEDAARLMSMVYAHLDPFYMLQAWSAREEHWRFLFALYTTGHPRTVHRTSAERVAQWRSAWLPLLGWLSLPPSISELPKVHFWVEGIDQDIRQMYPLLLPDDVATQLCDIRQSLVQGATPTIKGRPDVLTRLVDNALAGSAILRWASAAGCSPRTEEFYQQFLTRADRRPRCHVASELVVPSPELARDVDRLRSTLVFPALCAVLQEISSLASWAQRKGRGHGTSNPATPTAAFASRTLLMGDEEERKDDDASSTTTAVWASNASWMEEEDDDDTFMVVSAM